MVRALATEDHCAKGHPWTEETLYVHPTTAQRMCRVCGRDYSRTARRKRNRQEWFQNGGKDSMNEARRLRQYGLTPEQWRAMIQEQDGRCKICRRPPVAGKTLHVDHCHRTCLVRGLLCPPCNMAMGLMGEDVERLTAMISYLE